jgi:predicted RNase H-like HicB family nuclease
MKLRYAVVFERTPNNYAAGAPDVPGCVAAAKTWKKTQKLIAEALELHLQDLMDTGNPIPEPRMSLADAMDDYVAAESDGEDYGYSEFGDAVKSLEVTFGWVEVEAPDYAATKGTASVSRIADEA